MKKMSVLVAVNLALASCFGASALAATSTYTDIDLDKCKTISEPSDDDTGDFVMMECKGYLDYTVIFKEGDLRQSTYFGYLDQKIIDEAFDSFGRFNHIGAKVEWRLDDGGKPFAAILRYFIENPDEATGMPDKAHEGQVLVISRVGRPDDRRGCVAGYVDALSNPDANELARKFADDMAAGFQCGAKTPEFIGVKGEKAGTPANYYPALDQ